MVSRQSQLPILVFLLAFAPFRATEGEQLRLPRPKERLNQFAVTMSAGYAERWFQRLRSPSFCRMGLCHGTCADPVRSALDESIIGTPSLYERSEEVPPGITPCGLRTFEHLLDRKQGACCQP